MQTHEVDELAPPTYADCCSVEFASALGDGWEDARTLRPDFSVAISRRLGTIVVAVHGALNPTSSAQLRQILMDLVDHLSAGTTSPASET